VLQKAAAERDHFAHVITDWEHDPSAETIVGGLRFEVRGSIWRAICVVFCFDQTTRDQFARVITAPARPTAECIPPIGRKAELPTSRNFRRNAALLQIVAGH